MTDEPKRVLIHPSSFIPHPFRAYLRPHRAALAFALAGLLFQSALLLPVPLLQGWVLDRLADGPGGAAARADLARAVFAAFAVTVACYLLRAAVGWSVATIMHRVSLE